MTHLLIEDFRLVRHKKYFPEGAPTYGCEYRLLAVDFTKCRYEQMYPRSSDGTLAPVVFGVPPNQEGDITLGKEKETWKPKERRTST